MSEKPTSGGTENQEQEQSNEGVRVRRPQDSEAGGADAPAPKAESAAPQSAESAEAADAAAPVDASQAAAPAETSAAPVETSDAAPAAAEVAAPAPTPTAPATPAETPAAADAEASASAGEAKAEGDSAAEEGGPRRRVFDPTQVKEEVPEEPEPSTLEIEGADDFEAMLNAHTPDERQKELETGMAVEGRVIEIGSENVFIDLGGKTEAFMVRRDLLDDSGELTVQVGDTVSGHIVAFAPGGQVRVARKLTSAGSHASKDAVEQAFLAGIPVEGKVTGHNKGGFEVDVMGMRAFCPISHIEQSYTNEPDKHVGQSYTFRIIEFAENGGKFVVSRTAYLKEEAEAKAKELRKILEPGLKLKGTVNSIQEYGAFVDLGGIDGLVHISEISHSRVSHPKEVVEVGQTVEVQVLKIENSKKGERISLSMKAIESDPWEDLSWLKEGETYPGTVSRLANFGAFIELKPGVEGLVHVSEMSWERRVHHPSSVVSPGDHVDVAILSVEPHRRRISLSLKAAKGNPWEGAAERFPVDTQLDVTVERIADFGLFVKVDDGLIGLIPLSELGTQRGSHPSRDFQPGQTVSARVINVDEERQRLTLSRKDGAGGGSSRPRRDSGRGSSRGGGGGGNRGQRRSSGGGGGNRNYKEARGSFATFGDLLKDKIDKE